MKHNRVETELRKVVARMSNQDVSTLEYDDDLIAALGMDSLDGLRLVAAVEQHFGVYFPDEQISSLRTFHRLHDSLDAVLYQLAFY